MAPTQVEQLFEVSLFLVRGKLLKLHYEISGSLNGVIQVHMSTFLAKENWRILGCLD